MSKTSDNIAFVSEVQRRLQQRGEQLVFDGWGGDSSLAALDRHLPDLEPAIIEAGDSSAYHYQLASEYKGVREQPGLGTNPIIARMFDAVAPDWLPDDDSQTAWCGIFRAYIGHRAGTGIVQQCYRAAEWAHWGNSVRLSRPSSWHQGDTVVMTRPGGNHVALLDRVQGRKVYCLGGNQSNMVSVAPFSISRITHVRRA